MEKQKFMPEGWNKISLGTTKEMLKNAIQTGDILQGFVEKCDLNYNLHINFKDNIKGIIPWKEVEAVNVDKDGYTKPNICKNKVNKIVQFKVKNIDKNDNFILSRKEVGEEALTWIKEELHEGQVVKGIVRSIQSYGAFIEIGGGIVALLHIEDISVARMKSPIERLSIGEKLEVMIKSIDKEKNRVLLTYKELLGSWDENIRDYKEGAIVTGIAKEIEKNKNGIFIELKPNLVGMAEYKEGIEYGEKVSVYIKKIIPERKKIKLLFV